MLFQRSNGGEGLQILPSTEPLDSKNWKDTGVVDNALLVNIGELASFLFPLLLLHGLRYERND